MNVSIHFLGAAQSVTGSKHLLHFDDFQVLMDCGLFQGLKELRLRNWNKFPMDVSQVEALVLSHAHIDHIGYLPKLVKEGFDGPVYCTSATADLARILLLDSAKLQEEEAEWAKKKGYSKHNPPKPLYTTEEAENTFRLFQPYEFDEDIYLRDDIRIKFHNAGHILGAAWVELTVQRAKQQKTIIFSGDIGRYHQPVLRDPVSMKQADILITESTYGDRDNLFEDPSEEFAQIVNEAMEREGCLLIPAFALGRTQTVMYYLKKLMETGKIPKVPVYLDSPMAINMTQLYKRHFSYHKLHDEELGQDSLFDYEFFNYYRSAAASKGINEIRRNAIIVSSSGMCTGGRILHHLYHRLPRQEDTILFVGFQAKGTRGRRILEQEETIRIFGQDVPRKLQVRKIDGLSAHADKNELLKWVGTLQEAPKRTFIVHGETESAQALQQTLTQKLGWPNVIVPDYMEQHMLFENI
ncbi:MBL fold metallo-hydrolase RNA specificity domain-containing protein [Catalinimonas niigatensis]|uniref:MBL fold metallo-hydrolase RNA specificity domain-containing protein n=1 Tax=Catalinimonas niigatensis TaxID=1397264 RepID=UPI002665617D|nr:MBL fold metallo-hydrolase [Catalinimonas niigatensis]WPP49367.1 MBL fold metallo-hydrolase [Catalinimonas niigatensis]